MAEARDRGQGAERQKRPSPQAEQSRRPRPADTHPHHEGKRTPSIRQHAKPPNSPVGRPAEPPHSPEVRPSPPRKAPAKPAEPKPQSPSARKMVPLTILMTKAQKETIVRLAAASGKKVDDFILGMLLTDSSTQNRSSEDQRTPEVGDASPQRNP